MHTIDWYQNSPLTSQFLELHHSIWKFNGWCYTWFMPPTPSNHPTSSLGIWSSPFPSPILYWDHGFHPQPSYDIVNMSQSASTDSWNISDSSWTAQVSDLYLHPWRMPATCRNFGTSATGIHGPHSWYLLENIVLKKIHINCNWYIQFNTL